MSQFCSLDIVLWRWGRDRTLRLRRAWQGTQRAGIHTFCPPCHSMSLVGIRVAPPLEQGPRCHGFERRQDYCAGCQDLSRCSVLLHQGHGCMPTSQVLDTPKHLPQFLDKEYSFCHQRLDRCLLALCSESPLRSQGLCRQFQPLYCYHACN